jgi:hypothetical protein
MSVRESLMAGGSIRRVAATHGVSPGTVKRYRSMIATQLCEVICACGAPAGHRGWCAAGFEKSPQRQAFMSRWGARRPAIIRLPPRPLGIAHPEARYPFRPATDIISDGNDLLLFINGIVPRGLPEQLRGDVCQDLICAVLSGELPQCDVPTQLKAFTRQARGNAETAYMAVSLDQPRRDGTSWHDILPALPDAMPGEF